jgi:hypothetical protein
MGSSDLCFNVAGKRVGRDQGQHSGQSPLGVPEIVLLLKVEPERGGCVREPREADRHLWGHGGCTGQDAVKRLASNAQLAGRLADGKVKPWKHAVAED